MVLGEKKKIKVNTKASSGSSEKHQLVYKNVCELLECPVCTTLMSPPIFQCPNGHILCSVCKIQVSRCPICRNDMCSIRCLALEKVAEPLQLSYRCPYSDGPSECSVEGDIPKLLTHLKDDHNVLSGNIVMEIVHIHNYQTDLATGLISVLSCHGRQFCYKLEEFRMDNSPCYIAYVQFMGDDIEAKKFRYSLEIDANCRKLTWQGVPRSIRDSRKKIWDNLEGLVIPRKLLLALLCSGGIEYVLELRIKGRICID